MERGSILWFAEPSVEKRGDEMVGWHHRLDGHEYEQIPEDGEGQGEPGVLQSMKLQRIGHN